MTEGELADRTPSAGDWGWPVSLLFMATLVLTAAALSLALSALAQAVYESGLLAFDRPFTIVWWWVLPALFLACLVLGLRWRGRTPRWLWLLASPPLLGWIGLALYWYRRDELWYMLTPVAWASLALILLFAAVALPDRSRRRWVAGLVGLIVPAPMMLFIIVGITLKALVEG